MDYEAWVAWSENEGPLSEWIDGEVVVFEMPKGFHQEALGFLSILLRLFAQRFALGVVRPALFIMKLSDRSSREPDILFLASVHLGRLSDDRLDGSADLVIELIADDSIARDRRAKRAEYAAAGIPEYWIIDPRPGHWASTFLLLENGGYRELPLDDHGRYHSTTLPGFWFRPDWLWQEPAPDPLACLDEIAPAAFGRA